MQRFFALTLSLAITALLQSCNLLLAQTPHGVNASVNTLQSPPYKSRKNHIEVPVYRSVQDSITLATAEARYAQLDADPTADLKQLDSAEDLLHTLRQQAIVRHRILYSPSNEYTLLDSLKPADFATVTQLSIANRSLDKLPEALWLCTNLESLELVNCSIRKIQSDISRLPKLMSIAVLNNTSRRRLRLARNNTLESLTIHGDHPRSLPRSYKNLRALKILNLSDNRLTKFPNRAARNHQLKELNLQNNEITLAGKIKEHTSLEKLALQRNKISYVPASIARFPNLQQLSLNHNLITDVSPDIRELHKLAYVSFYNNQLVRVPDGLYQLHALKIIDLYFNQLEELDNRVSQWRDLEILFISHNKLYSLPAAVTSLEKLEEIHAYDNRLTRLPSDIDKLVQLRIINVQDNFIREVPPAMLSLSLLEEIDLSRNFMTHVPLQIFDYPYLKILSLRNNPWTSQTRQALRKKYDHVSQTDLHVNLTDMTERLFPD